MRNKAGAVPRIVPQDHFGPDDSGIIGTVNQTRTHIGNFRWTICALLFFAATINYIDRQVIGILKPTLKAELGWDEIAYSNVVFWFQTAKCQGFAGPVPMFDAEAQGQSLAEIGAVVAVP